MTRLFGIALLLLAFVLPAISQTQRMSAQDQDRFSGYYSQWVQDKQTNNRDDMIQMEQQMQKLMDKYGIPSNTPYDEVASQNTATAPGRYDRSYPSAYQGRLSSDDQKHFNDEYAKWQQANAKNDQHEIDKHARKMEDIMARNNISPNTPFDAVATANGASGHHDFRQYQGKFSSDDQKNFDKAYEHWVNDRRKNDRDDIAKDEGKMQEIMARYNIPRDVPYNVLASGSRGY